MGFCGDSTGIFLEKNGDLMGFCLAFHDDLDFQLGFFFWHLHDDFPWDLMGSKW